MDILETFIAPDRRRALAQNLELPDRAKGAVLFADVSGFTPLTEAMTRVLGARRGAEELTRQLNTVYDALIAEIDNFGGSVVTFAGDAALCWFPETAEGPGAALCAIGCAFALQEAMREFSAVQLPDGSQTTFAIKVTVGYGQVRRFVVGDPEIRRLDVMAGSAVARTATAEQLAHPGEILIDSALAQRLGAQVRISEWREHVPTQERFAVLNGLTAPVPPAPLPPTPPLPDSILQAWLHRGVYERIRADGELFLTELRPVVAMFVRFQGIDFDDADAAAKLDRFIVRVQKILGRYGGTLLELTIGDKGSYFYGAFGAPQIHEDDARRAVFGARELFPLCSELGFIEPLQIGISQGVMRVGGYGSITRRMYGAQGDEVNLAARLMIEAVPGTVLVSGRIQKVVLNEFDLEPLAPIRLKGKAEPLLPFVVQGLRETRVQQLQEAYYSLPMIGRDAEFARVQEKIERARAGHGHVVGITARAGMGKSRLTAEVVRTVRRQRDSSYGGECQSFGVNISYLVWAPIWRAFFGIDINLPLRRQIRTLENAVQDLAPARLDALPLLGTVLALSLPENDFTRALEPEFRKSALHALLLDCVRTAAADAQSDGHTLLFVIEDAHWIDPASRDLLQDLAAQIETLPVILLLNYRPPESETEQLPRLKALPNFTEIALQELTGAQGEGLIRAKIAQHAPETSAAIPNELIGRLLVQAQGNPFYIEQLLDYVHDRGINFREGIDFSSLDLPTTLQRLILSRMDQLNERQQLTLKAASIIGRWFTLAHLCGYFPKLGKPDQVEADLALLQSYDLTLRDQPEPELGYLFKHLITHQVAYESLPYATRAMLHEAYARYLETFDDATRALDLIAFHYDHSENLPKRKEYLRRAGEAAAARFANTEAIDYLTRALALAPADSFQERFDLLTAREHVLDVQGEREQQRRDLREMEQCAIALNDRHKQTLVLLQQGWLAERMSEHTAATRFREKASEMMAAAGLSPETLAALEMDASLLHGVILWQQGNPAGAKPHFEHALEAARALGNPIAEGRALSFLGTVYREGSEYARAQAYYLEQLQVARKIRDARREWSALNNLGLIAAARGDSAGALDYYNAAITIVREIGDRLGEELILSNIAIAAMDQGEYLASLDYGQQAMRVAKSIGDRRSVCRILLNLGEAHRLMGEYPDAGTYFKQSFAMAGELGDQLHRNFALMNLAALALDEQAPAQVQTLVAEGLPLAEAIQHREGAAFLLNTLGQAQLSQAPAAAQAAFDKALAIWQTLEPMVYALEAFAGLAELALRQEDFAIARAHTRAILAFLQTRPQLQGAPAALHAALTAYRVLEQAHDPQAREVLRSAYTALQARAAKIPDPVRRRSFLENVQANRALAQTAREILAMSEVE